MRRGCLTRLPRALDGTGPAIPARRRVAARRARSRQLIDALQAEAQKIIDRKGEGTTPRAGSRWGSGTGGTAVIIGDLGIHRRA